MWAIIGGSGFESFPEFKMTETLDRNTPYGPASSGASRAQIADENIIFIPRHGSSHEHAPGDVNYRANIYLLKKLGVTKIFSISAIGSLREELKPGEVVIPSQYIDRTKGKREHTFAENGFIGHVSLANPVSDELVEALKAQALNFPFTMHFDRTYICIEGPAFSTRAESLHYRAIGADIIGMTNFPEYALAREAGICYLPTCFVTDYDCWREDTAAVDIQQVIETMRRNRRKAFELVKNFIPRTSQLCPQGCRTLSFAQSMISHPDALSEQQKELLRVLAE